MRRKRHQTSFANRIEGSGLGLGASAEGIVGPDTLVSWTIDPPGTPSVGTGEPYHFPGIRVLVVDNGVLKGP